MASGGNYPSSSLHNCRQPGGGGGAGNNSSNRNSIDNECDNENPVGPPWLLTANNLSLHTSAPENRLSKKQRNKTKPKLFPITDISSISAAELPSTRATALRTETKTTTAIGNQNAIQKPVKLNFQAKIEAARFRKPFVPPLEEVISDTGIVEIGASADIRFKANQRRHSRNVENSIAIKKSTENCPLSNNKQDNTKKLPDTSVLVERLMHLRDCINQVTSIMQNLEKTDGPVTRGQLGNLDQMLGQLRNEEQENLELLQQLLVFRENVPVNNNAGQNCKLEDSSSCCSDVAVNPGANNHQENNEETFEETEKQNQLLQKMAASQKKLESLREQQAALLNMQRKAETRLAEVKAFHEHLLQNGLTVEEDDDDEEDEEEEDEEEWSVPAHLQNGAINMGGGGVSALLSEPDHPINVASTQQPSSSSFNGILNLENDLEIHSNATTATAGAIGGAVAAAPIKKDTRKRNSKNIRSEPLLDLENFGHQVLHDLGINRQINADREIEEEEEDEEVAGRGGGGDDEENSSEILTDLHRKKLENKLRELQEKKHQMDSLLAELSSLQVTPQPKEQHGNDCKAKQNGHSRGSVYAIQDANQVILESTQTTDKMRQLEDLKKKLSQLKVLTDNLELTNANLDSAVQTQTENSQWSGRLPKGKKDKIGSSSLKSDNLRRDHTSPGFPARRHYEAEGRANEDGDSAQPIPPSAAAASLVNGAGGGGANKASPISTVVSASSPASSSSSLPFTSAQEQALMEEHAEIEAKVSKLLATKNKLQQLHGLLGAVHQYRQTGEPLPNEVHQFLSGLQSSFGGNCLSPSSPQAPRGTSPSPDIDPIIEEENGNLSAGGGASSAIQGGPDFERLNQVEEQLTRQHRELQHLTEERKRLLTMQEQLLTLQQQQQKQYSTLKNNEQRSSGEGGTSVKRDQRATNQGGGTLSASLSNLLVASLPIHETNRSNSGRRDNLNRQQQESARSSISTDNQTTVTKDVNSSGTSSSILGVGSKSTTNLLNVSQRNEMKKYEQTGERIGDQSLSDLNEELNHSLALRDELQHQKCVLQELLRQEQSKQIGFSQNQDQCSQSGSSEKSELVENCSSVLAPDTTVAATWGGSSTQDNLDDEVEEQLESLEEQDEDEEESVNDLKGVSEGRLQTLLQPCVDPQQAIPESENYQRRRNNRTSRVHGYRRGLLNQWRKNFQVPTRKNETQANYQEPRQENCQTSDQAGSAGSSDLQSNSESHWRQFTKHIQQQLEQTNILCQSVLKDQQALGSILFSFSHNAQQQQTIGPSAAVSGGQSSSISPDMFRYYSHLQQQQQHLLLSLSHCYHTLYLQQVEIVNLQSYLQQSPESEGVLPPPLNNFHVGGIDDFRPRCMSAPWMMNMPTGNSIAPSLSPFMHPTPTVPTSAAPSFSFNPVPPSAPQFPTNTSAVIPPPRAAQDERGAAETLNNQVPPGTRANNFLDNFRSYSRQNLLSAATNQLSSKSNEHPPPLPSTPSTPSSAPPPLPRPSYTFGGAAGTGGETMLPSIGVQRRPLFPTVFEGNNSLPTTVGGRRASTPNTSALTSAANGGAGGVRPRTKRPNLNQEQGGSIARRTPGCLNLLSLLDPSRLSLNSQNSTNQKCNPTEAVQQTLEPAQTPRRLGECESNPENFDSLRDSIYMEVTSLISSYEQQPHLLNDLLKQLQHLGTEQRSTTTIPGRIVSSLNDLLQSRQLNVPCAGARKKQMEMRNKSHSHNVSSLSDFSRARLGSDSQIKSPLPLLVSENISQRPDLESPAMRLGEQAMESPVDESSSSSNSWPKGSSATGAVQKKYNRHFSGPSSHLPFVPPPPEASEEILSDTLVKQTVLSLVPFLQGHLSEECSSQLQAQLCNHILNALQNLPVHQPLLRFFRSQLLQSLQQMLDKYTGKRVRDCEEDMLMEITEVVMKEMAIQKIMQKKKDETQRRGGGQGNDWSSISVNRGSASNFGAINPGTDFDSPRSNESRFQGSEAFSENELTGAEIQNLTLENRHEWGVSAAVAGGGGETNQNHQTQSSELDYPLQKITLEMQPDRLDVRAAPDGLAAAPATVPPLPLLLPPGSVSLHHPLSPRLLEEESGYDCDAEGETEPEIEAETDDTKDLAEADQSAGGISHALLQSLNGRERGNSSTQPRRGSNGSGTGDENTENETNDAHFSRLEDRGAAGGEALPQGQTSAAEGEGEELTLDDIPTKLEIQTTRFEICVHETIEPEQEEAASNQLIQEILCESQFGINGGAVLLGGCKEKERRTSSSSSSSSCLGGAATTILLPPPF